MNMLADQSFSRSNLQMPEMTTPAFQSEFHGLPLPEEEQLWNLGPISPTMSSWDAKADYHQQQQQQQQAFANASLERDSKNAHVRNGQPTPPPFNDPRTSHDVYPPLPQYQLGATPPPAFPDQDRHHRSLSDQSMFDDDPPYSPAVSSSSNNNNNANNGHVRRHRGRDSGISKPMGYSGSGRPEGAKREKFLERNRLAASKCRQKKKENTLQLETQFKEQSGKKELLVNEIARLRSEILGLKNEVLRHSQCGDEPIKLHLAQMVKRITYNDNSGSGAPEISDGAEAVSTSEDSSSPVVSQHQSNSHHQHHQQGMVSFGFDDALQMEPAATGSLEQQMRRESETSQASQETYGFSSTDDNFDDLINV